MDVVIFRYVLDCPLGDVWRCVLRHSDLYENGDVIVIVAPNYATTDCNDLHHRVERHLG